MAVIHKITTYSISYELENDIRKKALSEEEIANVFEQFSSKNKLLTKRVKILCIIAVVIGLISGISTYVSTEEIALAALTGGIYLVIMGIAAYAAWYCNIGKITKKWNSLIKSYYSQIQKKRNIQIL